VRGATPFTDRLTEGTQEGHYVIGQYLSRYDLDGNERNLYSRLELATPGSWLHFDHWLRTGIELRRDWNSGPGYQFAIEFPPQVTFNGVNGYDRPRPFDAVPPMATTAAYLDDRLVRAVFGGVTFEMQAGLRLDLLHRGSWWTSAVRDAALQPRITAQLSPVPWLRLRGAWGLTAKSPTLAQLSPAPQYFDVVNVNYYANDPAERLAILTTFIRDPSNPDLGFSIGHKSEAGIEFSTPHGDAALAVTVFQDKTTGGIGVLQTPAYLLRDHYALTDTTLGDGRPPTVVFPPEYTDTVPVLIDQPANILTLDSKGIEGTVSLPELRPLGLRLEVTGAWVKTSFF